MAQILVVDDDWTIRDLVGDVLEHDGFAVRTAGNGVEALQQVRASKPDGIVLDLMMPVMDGRTFAERCHGDALCRGTPIIVMSAAHDLHGAAQRLQAFGVRAVVAKPFDMDALVALVERYVAAVN